MLPHRSEDHYYIYQTPHFELHSQVKLSEKWAREFAMACESTLTLFQQLPLTSSPVDLKHKRFVVRLFSNRNQYLQAGGDPAGDACYDLRSAEVLFPLTALRRNSSTSFAKLENPFSALVHEVAHQLVHSVYPFHPIWLQEGIATFVQTLPLHDGAYLLNLQHIETLIHRLEHTSDRVCLHDLFDLGSYSWRTKVHIDPKHAEILYVRSVVLTAYFLCHDSESLTQYVHALKTGQPELLARRHLMGNDGQDCTIFLADIKRQLFR